jgi:hypothetical protein
MVEKSPTPEQERRTGNAGSTPAALTVAERIERARIIRDELIQMKELERVEEEIRLLQSHPAVDPLGRRRSASITPAPREEMLPHVSELQPEKLKEYYGRSIREHREWTQSAENAFRLAPRRFHLDTAKIAWTAQFLRGTPATTWLNEVDTLATELYTWEEYKHLLLELIEDAANRELDAAQLYADARQKTNQTVQQFNQYLISLERQLDAEYTEEQRRTHLWTKLLPEIRAPIMMYQDIPHTRDAIVSLATRLEKNIIKKRAASPTPDDKRARPKPQTKGFHGQNAARTQDTRPASEFNKASVVCWKCREKGHYANKCPNESAVPSVATTSTSSQGAGSSQGKDNRASWNPRKRS